MLGPETIRNISDVAAYRAAEEGRKPLAIWRGSEEQDARNIPFLGSYCPVGYRPAIIRDLEESPEDRDQPDRALPDAQADAVLSRCYYRPSGDIVDLLVDASDFGEDSEPALTFDAFCALAGGGYWAIVEEGQFQVVIRLYVRDDAAPGTDGPSEDDVTCDACLTIHNDLEECESEWCDTCDEQLPYDHECVAYEYCHGCDKGITEGDAHVIEFFAWSVAYRDEDESGVLCDTCYDLEGPHVDKAYDGDAGQPEHLGL
jgi:hypothetical protein